MPGPAGVRHPYKQVHFAAVPVTPRPIHHPLHSQSTSLMQLLQFNGRLTIMLSTRKFSEGITALFTLHYFAYNI